MTENLRRIFNAPICPWCGRSEHAPECYDMTAARAELEALEAENERLRAKLAEADKRGWRRGIEESLRIFDEECDNLCPGVPEEAGGVLFEIEDRLRGLIGERDG